MGVAGISQARDGSQGGETVRRVALSLVVLAGSCILPFGAQAQDLGEEERIRKEREDEVLLFNASDEELAAAIAACRAAVEARFAPGDGAHFARYKPLQLTRLARRAAADGVPLGRPSETLDEPGLDPDAYNLGRLRDREHGQIRIISYIVEHPPQVTHFTCAMEGIHSAPPEIADQFSME